MITNFKYKKNCCMSEFKLRQLKYETDTWKRLLGFVMEENIHLKNRLSEVLKENFDKNLLNDVEKFYAGFIKEDELIGLLRNDIAELNSLLTREVFEDGMTMKQVERKVKKLRHGVKAAEEHFGKLKSAFNSYLSENIY
jgi:late competence protein required for DNA uptake (superfamily II DNA/RNA helicase)